MGLTTARCSSATRVDAYADGVGDPDVEMHIHTSSMYLGGVSFMWKPFC